MTDLLEYNPVVTAVLAAIGLATVVFLFWQSVKPLVQFFASSRTLMLMTMLTGLTVAGAASLGYGIDETRGAFHGGGVAGIVLGLVFTIFFWWRKYTKWMYNEKEEYS